jgi:integrase
MSDVQLHKNGEYWLARWRDSSRRRRAKSLGPIESMSRAAALRACREIQAKMIIDPGAKDRGRAPTLGQWRDSYFEQRDDISDLTRVLHQQTIRLLVEFAGEGLRLDRFTRTMAMDWRKEMGTKVGPATVAKHIRNAKVFFSWAQRQDLVAVNPFDRISGTAPKVAHDWREVTHADAEKMLEHAPTAQWRCLIALCRWAGLRRGEALRLAWGDVDFVGKTIRVVPELRHGSRTVGTKQGPPRAVPIRPSLLTVLQAAHDEAEDGSRGPCAEMPGIGNLDRDAERLAIRAGVGAYAKPFHTLRKCCESEWMRDYPAMDVCKWMGHSAQVAAEHYHRPSEASVSRVTSGKTQDQTIAELQAELARLRARETVSTS